MYRCEKCGHLFEEGEQKKWEENGGEIWQGCPICEGAFEEAETCEVCGAVAEELHGGVCDECIKENSNFETCYTVSKNEKEEIKINVFLANFFTESEIERILLDEIIELKRLGRKIDCSEFVESDKEWFGEQIARLK